LKVRLLIHQTSLTIPTPGRGLIEITDQVVECIVQSEVKCGLASIFIQHTSASLTITENADPTVLADLETVFQRLAPDGDPEYRHDYEGEDDMAAHIRSVLTTNELSLPITNGRLALGTWQGIFVWEHRYRAYSRSILVTIIS